MEPGKINWLCPFSFLLCLWTNVYVWQEKMYQLRLQQLTSGQHHQGRKLNARPYYFTICNKFFTFKDFCKLMQSKMFSLSLPCISFIWGVKNLKTIKLNPTKLHLRLILSSMPDLQLMHPSSLFHCSQKHTAAQFSKFTLKKIAQFKGRG